MNALSRQSRNCLKRFNVLKKVFISSSIGKNTTRFHGRTRSIGTAIADCHDSYKSSIRAHDHQLPQLTAQKLDNNSSGFKDSMRVTDALVAQLNDRIDLVRQGGGKAAVQKHLARNKMMARDRIDALVDYGTPFLELSALAGMYSYPDDNIDSDSQSKEMNVPSGSIVTGIGIVAGVPTMIFANDATVKGGTYHAITVKKHLRAQGNVLKIFSMNFILTHI